MKISLILSLIIYCYLGATLHASDEDYRVVILGNGIEDGQEEIDKESLVKILQKIKEENPDALFFTGNLIEGLEQSTSLESMSLFEQRMNQFVGLVHAYLGDKVHLYPVLGNHTFVNARAVALFKKKFHINEAAPLDAYQVAYSVALDRVQFVVLASGIYERVYPGYLQPLRVMPILDWLEKELRSGNYRYRFVIGHLPAFSTRASEGVFVGMDNDVKRRDFFWNALKNNRVLGYFASHEPVYDRSNRGGVWQIISGGIGEKKKVKEGMYVFEHFMLLKIPKDVRKNPTMEAVDLTGKKWDKFEIVPSDRPVHHLRISRG